MTTGGGAGRWVDDPPLPEITPPPSGVPLTLGATLIRVYDVAELAGGERRRRGYTEAVILARTPYPAGGWAALAAWLGSWQQGTHTTGRARWGWVRLPGPDDERVQPMPRPSAASLIEGAEWHGHHELSEFAEAVRQASATLPEGDRAAALTPLDPDRRDAAP